MSRINHSARRKALVALASVAPAVVALTSTAPANATPAPRTFHTAVGFNPACASPTGPLGPFGPLGPAGPFGPGGIVSQNPALFYQAFYSVWVTNPAVGGLSQICFGLDLTGIVPPPM
jgi:hypothetical protein